MANGYSIRPLVESSPRPGVTRIADEDARRWIEYETTGWRIRRIASSEDRTGKATPPPNEATSPTPAQTAASLTLNAATTLRDRDRRDDGFDAPHTGTGRTTPLAARGVFASLRRAGCAIQVADDEWKATSWRITPLGEAVQAYVRANWDTLKLCDPAAEQRTLRASRLAREFGPGQAERRDRG